MIAVDAGRAPRIGLAGVGVGGRAASDVRIAFGTRGRRAGAIVGAAARAGGRRCVGRRALPGVRVVVRGARDLASTACGAGSGSIVAARVVAGPRVVLLAGVIT